MSISVKLKVFEGSLDRLLHLLHRNKIDIYDIPVAELAGQYMEYPSGTDEEELDVMSEFLMAAATLLEIKCRTLLPAAAEDEDGEESPGVEPAELLLQYRMYKHMAFELKSLEPDAERIFYRAPAIPAEVAGYIKPPDLDILLDGVTLNRLNEIFREAMMRREDRKGVSGSQFGTVRKEKVTLADKLSYIKNYAKKHEKFSFRRLLERQADKMQVITTFLAVLELIKSGAVRATQEEICGELMIYPLI